MMAATPMPPFVRSDQPAGRRHSAPYFAQRRDAAPAGSARDPKAMLEPSRRLARRCCRADGRPSILQYWAIQPFSVPALRGEGLADFVEFEICRVSPACRACATPRWAAISSPAMHEIIANDNRDESACVRARVVGPFLGGDHPLESAVSGVEFAACSVPLSDYSKALQRAACPGLCRRADSLARNTRRWAREIVQKPSS